MMTIFYSRNNFAKAATYMFILGCAVPAATFAQGTSGSTGTGASTGSSSAATGTGAGAGQTGMSGVGQSGSPAANPDGSQNTGVNGGQTTSSNGGQPTGLAGPQNNGQTGGQSTNQTQTLTTGPIGENNASSGPAQTSNNMNLGDLASQPSPQGSGLTSLAPNAPPVYDLASAVRSTIQTSSDFAIAKKDLQRDQAIVQEQASQNYPKINASGTYTRLDSPISIPFAGNEIVVQPENTEAFDATGILPIDISGQVRAATQAAQLQVMADRFNLDRIRNGLILNAQTAYFNELRAQHQVQVATTALSDAQTQLKTATVQYQGGIGQKIDVYRAQTQVSQAQEQLLQAQNALSLSVNNFNDVVGRPLVAPVTVQDVPGVTVGTTIGDLNGSSAVGGSDTTASFFFAPPATELNSINVNNDIATALKARPELREDLVNIQAAAKQIALARASDEPTLSLGATGDYYPVTDFQTPRHSLGIYTVTLNIPVFDGGLAQDRERAARASRDASKISYSSDQTDVELQVRQAYLNLYTTSNQIAAANSALQEAIAARQLAEVRYSNGVGLYLEVTDAESALTNAENSQVNAVYDYLIARAQYDNAVGNPNAQPTL